MTLFELALQLFIITNPIGNSPAILALVKDYSFAKQQWIMLRETFFALCLALFFQFLGEPFLDILGIKDYALSWCGGVLMLIVGIQMIFPSHEEEMEELTINREPYMVPIATPLLSGPGLITFIMLYSKQLNDAVFLTSGLLIAWVGVIAVMLAAPLLLRLMGRRGLYALEQLMGLVLIMIGMELIVKGSQLFIGIF